MPLAQLIAVAILAVLDGTLVFTLSFDFNLKITVNFHY